MFRAAYADLTSYTLSNRLCLTVALLFPLYILATWFEGHMLPLPDIMVSLGLASLLFIICAVFFALGVMGGGDVKLIPAVALWAGTAHIIPYLFITTVIGGIIAGIIIIRYRIIASKYYKSSGNINLSVAKKTVSAVPYGVGIAVGGLYIAYQLFASLDSALILGTKG